MSGWSCNLQFRVVEGVALGREYPLAAPRIVIGRVHPEAEPGPGTLQIEDDTVSRIQADLSWNPNTQSYSFTNRSQTNPTRVNEVAVDRVDLAPGDRIRMGRCLVELQQIEVPRPSVGAPPPPPRPVVAIAPSPSNKSKPQRVLSLSHRPNFSLEHLGGPEAGQMLAVTGLTLALGGPGGPPSSALERWFDQDVVLEACELPPRSLALSWKELRHGFELSRRETSAEVVLERVKDGFVWTARLPADRPCLLGSGDVIRVGEHRLRLVTQ